MIDLDLKAIICAQHFSTNFAIANVLKVVVLRVPHKVVDSEALSATVDDAVETSSAPMPLMMTEGNVLVQYWIISSAERMASLGALRKLSFAVQRLMLPPIPSQEDLPWEVAKKLQTAIMPKSLK